MSAAFEAFLARLYVESEFRARFLQDRRGEALRAGLNENETIALLAVPESDLEVAAHSFERKRSKNHHKVSYVQKKLSKLKVLLLRPKRYSGR